MSSFLETSRGPSFRTADRRDEKTPVSLHGQETKTVDTRSLFLRIRRKDIAYFKFIAESYEGMAVVRTRDPYEAVVELMVAPGWEREAEAMLRGLQTEIPLEKL